jgi:F-type H+-transporting ATPase subunit b
MQYLLKRNSSKISSMNLLTPDLGLFIWNLIGFLILFLILRATAWKPILKSLNEREKGISDALATAEKVKAEMAQLKSENEALLEKAREERAQLLKEARETRDKMVGEAKDLAKQEAARIIADARVAIEQQKMAALTEVKNQVGNLVVEVAEKILRRELADKNQQESYIRELTDEAKLN